MNTIEYLENAIDNHVSDYITPLEQEGYEEDQITQKMIDDNFFMFQPLLDFESSLGFNSLRQEFWQIENDWIQAGGSNASDPNNDMVLDKIAQAIVDPDYNVIIDGNTINMLELNNSGEKSNCQKTDRESDLISIDSKHRLKTWVGLQYWGGSTSRHYAETWYQYKSGSTWLGGITKYSMLIGQDGGPGGFSHLYDCSNQEFGLVVNNFVGIANRGYTVRSSWTSDAVRYSFRGEDLFENAGWVVRLGGMYHHKF